MMETPTICASSYGTSAGALLGNLGQQRTAMDQAVAEIDALVGYSKPSQLQITAQPIMANSTQRRIVQVFIADPNDNVPLEHSILYKGEQKLTDLNDNELFFEIPMAETLKSHNDKRVKWLDKEASKRAGKDLFLDPAKIRDLKMLVVTIAAF